MILNLNIKKNKPCKLQGLLLINNEVNYSGITTELITWITPFVPATSVAII